MPVWVEEIVERGEVGGLEFSSTTAARLASKVVFIWLSISSGLNGTVGVGGLGVATWELGGSGALGTGVAGGGWTEGGVGVGCCWT